MWKKLNFKTYQSGSQGAGMTPLEEWQRFINGFDFFSLIESWRSIVGDMLAEESIPLRLKNRTLFILTRHPAFAEQLKFMENILLDKISRQFPEAKSMLKSIAFENHEDFFKQKVEALVKKPIPKPHAFSPLYRKAKLEAEEIFSEVTDPEEKARWVSLYLQSQHSKDL